MALDDFGRAQALLDAQLQVNWPIALNELVGQFHPVHAEWMPASCPVGYYWSVEQSEWATDVVFRSAAALAALCPRLVHHGITTFSSRGVLRFLQQKVPAQGGVHGRFAGEVVSDLKHRPEGVRIRHAYGLNSQGFEGVFKLLPSRDFAGSFVGVPLATSRLRRGGIEH